MPSKPITAFESAQHRMKGDRAALHLTVEVLIERYTQEGRYLPDGSLKTEGYLEHVRQTDRYLAWLGVASEGFADFERIHARRFQRGVERVHPSGCC